MAYTAVADTVRGTRVRVRAQVKKFQETHPAASADGISRVSFGSGSVGDRFAPPCPERDPRACHLATGLALMMTLVLSQV